MTHEAEPSSEQLPSRRKNILGRAIDKIIAPPAERQERPRIEAAGYVYHSDELNIHANVYRESYDSTIPIRADRLVLQPSENSLDIMSYPYDYPVGGGEVVRGTRFVVQEAVPGSGENKLQIQSSLVEHIPGNENPYIYGGRQLGLPFRDEINERGYVTFEPGLTTYRFSDLPQIQAMEAVPDDLDPAAFFYESRYTPEMKVLSDVLGTVNAHSRRRQ